MGITFFRHITSCKALYNYTKKKKLNYVMKSPDLKVAYVGR